MFDSIKNLFRKKYKVEEGKINKDAAKERLHLVLMQDRANVSADFLDLMKQEIIDVIKKYVDIDEKEIDVKLTSKQNSDGTVGAPALYANIPIKGLKVNRRGRKSVAATKVAATKQDTSKPVAKKEETTSKATSNKKVAETKNATAVKKAANVKTATDKKAALAKTVAANKAQATKKAEESKKKAEASQKKVETKKTETKSTTNVAVAKKENDNSVKNKNNQEIKTNTTKKANTKK